jgi:hypothetical protein
MRHGCAGGLVSVVYRQTARIVETQSCSDAGTAGTCNVANPLGVSLQLSYNPLPLGRGGSAGTLTSRTEVEEGPTVVERLGRWMPRPRISRWVVMQTVTDAVAILRKLISVIPQPQHLH